MPYTIKPGLFKYKKSNGQFSEIDCFEGPDLTEEVAALEKGKAPIIIDSATGNPIVIKDGADSLPVEGMKIHFLPKQDTSGGDPSPSHVCPISGWTGITAWRTGVNLLPNKKYQYTETQVRLGGENSTEVYKKLKAGTYTLSVTGNVTVQCYYTHNSVSTLLGSNGGTLIVTEADEDKSYCFYCYKSRSLSVDDVLTWQLELGSTATPYTPYTEDSYPVTFPDGQTVYGGTLDAVNGVLTVDTEFVSFRWGDVNGTSVGDFTRKMVTGRLSNYPNHKYTPVCNVATYKAQFSEDSLHFYVNSTASNNVIVFLPNDVDEDTIVQVAYPLATPIEIQLDPITVQTLLGDNTIWSNANGDIELDYRADTKLFVDMNNPVTDIRVKGTSLVQNGIVNMPLAQASTPGLMMVGAGYGLKAADINGNSAGRIQTDQAWPDLIKGFADQYRPITPKYLPDAVFQGLARAAGDTTQAASSNAVGTFTSDAIVAIQKMLGVYQAPWELIREDSFTNDLTTASDHIITVDSNGQPFELTDVLMLFELPQNENTAEKGYYGQIWFYYDTDSVIAPEPGSASRAANGYSQGAWYMINYSNKIVTTQSTTFTTNTNSTYWRARYIQYISSAANSNMGIFVANDFAITKINIKQVKGEGHYKLYGRRKWTT